MDKVKISPVQFIPLSFFAVIMLGTFLLMLPVSNAQHEWTHFLTALFTATTSVCVTGLVVVDTYAHWSMFGQTVILFLIQIGGLGVVAVGSMIMLISRRKFFLHDRILLEDSLNVDKKVGLLRFLSRMFRGVIIVELTGTLLCAVKLVPMMGFSKGLWASLFQSVSAFCNAGMDVIGPNSMIDLRTSYLLMITTMLLIIFGGIGFVVWFDLIDGIRDGIRSRFSPLAVFQRLPEHAKLVIIMTAFLIIFGAAVTFAAEYSNPGTMADLPLSQKILNSFFQSVTYRTAGFASIPQDKLTEVSCMTGYLLMFIGGSPVGTAGGIKTVTAFLFFINAYSYINGKNENIVFGKRVPEDMMKKASAIFFFSIMAVLFMTVMLMATNPVNLTDALYEVISALGTVGLSRNLTPNLNRIGRIIIIISMYLGRIGPISMAFFFSKKKTGENSIKHARGNFYVG